MERLVNKDTKVIVQGITGREGRLHTAEMLSYGTRIVAGVTPGKGGERVLGIPVYDSVEEAVERHGAEASVVFVPAPYAPDAVYEAVDSGLRLIVVVTEHIPIHETIRMVRYASCKGSMIIGPNTPGLIIPNEVKLGIMPHRYFVKGDIGIVSRSGTLTYEVAGMLMRKGLGVSIAVGVGGDPVTGLSLAEAARMLSEDPRTKCIVVVGEIGGGMEERLAEEYSKGLISKKVIAFVAGKEAPPGKRMGHAGALIMGERGSAISKIKAFKRAGIPVADTILEIPDLVTEALS